MTSNSEKPLLHVDTCHFQILQATNYPTLNILRWLREKIIKLKTTCLLSKTIRRLRTILESLYLGTKTIKSNVQTLCGWVKSKTPDTYRRINRYVEVGTSTNAMIKVAGGFITCVTTPTVMNPS